MNHPIIKMNQSAEIRKYVRALIERETPTAAIQQEVKTYFGVEMSHETIRTARKRMNAKKNEPARPVKNGGSSAGSKNEPVGQEHILKCTLKFDLAFLLCVSFCCLVFVKDSPFFPAATHQIEILVIST